MVRMLVRVKQFIAVARAEFRQRREIAASALGSPKQGAALRAAMLDNAGSPKVVKHLLKVSRKHNLGGRQ